MSDILIFKGLTPERVSEILNGSQDVDWLWIQEKKVDYDADKSIEYLETILQRRSDGKYFKVEWSENNYHRIDNLNPWPLPATEVFPKQKTITVYE
jgi:hypothetical protein